MQGDIVSTHKFGILGAILGGGIGYLYRPSALIVGQLPFNHVISRGKSLKGLDQVLLPVAETSFNYLIGGIIIGAVLGYALKAILDGKNTRERKDGQQGG